MKRFKLVKFDDPEKEEEALKKFLAGGITVLATALMDIPSRRVFGELIEAPIFKYDAEQAEYLTEMGRLVSREHDIKIVTIGSIFVHFGRRLSYFRLDCSMEQPRREKWAFIMDLTPIDMFNSVAAGASSGVMFFTSDDLHEGQGVREHFGVTVDGKSIMTQLRTVAGL